jgi:hypothetical protein
LSNAGASIAVGPHPTSMPSRSQAPRSALHSTHDRSVSGSTALAPWPRAHARAAARPSTVSSRTWYDASQYRDQDARA